MERQEHRLEVDLPANAAVTVGDHKRLVQIVANLLSNAAKYTPKGGRIALAMAVDGNELLVSVSDNGIGMSADLVANAFEIFAQDSDSPAPQRRRPRYRPGVVKNLVQMHGGTVRAESAGAGHGSRFELRLPSRFA